MVNNLSGYTGFGAISQNTTIKTDTKKSVDKNNADINNNQSAKSKCSAENIRAYQTAGIQNNLNSADVQKKYNEVSSLLEPETRVTLSNLLKTGVLLNNNCNDKSTVLDNLHKMATTPRIKGLDTTNLLTEAINTVADPNTITQNFGDVPDNVARALFRHADNLGVNSPEEININESGSCTCVAASMEYNLASSSPAEFVRLAEGLSSENYSVDKTIPLTDIAETKEDSLWLLKQFNVPYEIDENDNAHLTISPDRNAIVRARVQTSYKDEGERSPIDVLLQSAFMNLGSQQTYNSLNDTREAGLFSEAPDKKCLSSFEIAFTESIVDNSPKDIVVSMNINQNGEIFPVWGKYTPEQVASSVDEKLNAAMPETANNLDKEALTEIMPDTMMSIMTETVSEIMQSDVSDNLKTAMNYIMQQNTESLMSNYPDLSTKEIREQAMPAIMNETIRSTMQIFTQNVMKSSIIQSLQQGNNVMVGYISLDENGLFSGGGHEINIIGAQEAPTGEMLFVCKDTEEDEPVVLRESFLLPRLYNTSLPKNIIDYDNMGTMLSCTHDMKQQTEQLA